MHASSRNSCVLLHSYVSSDCNNDVDRLLLTGLCLSGYCFFNIFLSDSAPAVDFFLFL